MAMGGRLAGAGVAVLAAAAYFVRGVDQNAAVMLESTAKLSTLRANLDDIAQGSYVRQQSVDIFCSGVASLATGQNPVPGDTTSFESFVRDRTTGSADFEEYVEGKASSLGAAWEIAQRNPQAARRYAEACLRF